MSKQIYIQTLLGKTFVKVSSYGEGKCLAFFEKGGKVFAFFHEQECCEEVTIEEIAGELSSLEGNPILVAEESTQEKGGCDDNEHQTWTFYKFATIKGWVDVRWCGVSNGYYSEKVSLFEYEDKEEFQDCF